MICHWAINRTDPQNLLSTTLDVPLYISGLLTILLVSLLRCVKVDTLGTPCEEDLD